MTGSAICLYYEYLSIGISRAESTSQTLSLTDSLILELVDVALEGPSRSNDADLDEVSE